MVTALAHSGTFESIEYAWHGYSVTDLKRWVKEMYSKGRHVTFLIKSGDGDNSVKSTNDLREALHRLGER